MSSLERRKVMAEFAGWTDIVLAGSGANLFGAPPGMEGFSSQRIPRYESDPAAACSLLPKLMPLVYAEDMKYPSAPGRCAAIWAALNLGNRDGEICLLILDAVLKVQARKG